MKKTITVVSSVLIAISLSIPVEYALLLSTIILIAFSVVLFVMPVIGFIVEYSLNLPKIVYKKTPQKWHPVLKLVFG